MISIRVLKASGLTDKEVLRVLEVEQEERLATVREQNRIRQRNHRARNDVTRDQRDMRDTSIREVSKKERKEVSKEGRKRPLPPDFQPDLAWAVEKRKWTSEEAAAEAERFRYHYLASGTPWVDWQCVWRKWVTSPFQQKGNGNGNGHAPRPHSREDREERTGIALAKLRAYARGGGEAGRQTTLGLPEPEEPA